MVVFGAGPVGLFAAKSAWLMGAGRVIVVDHIDYRLEFARRFAHAETVNFNQVDDIVQWVKETTEFLGADVCIEAVGAEADGAFFQHITERQVQAAGRLAGGAELVHRQPCARAGTSAWSVLSGRSSARSSSATR